MDKSGHGSLQERLYNIYFLFMNACFEGAAETTIFEWCVRLPTTFARRTVPNVTVNGFARGTIGPLCPNQH